MMVCFDASDCYSVGVNFENMPRVPKLVLSSVVGGQEYILYEQELDMKMYEFIHAGEGRYHSVFTQFKTNYNQPTLIVHPARQQVVDVKFEIDNNLARQMNNIKVYLR
jgi:diphthamide synthase subunit DPH2